MTTKTTLSDLIAAENERHSRALSQIIKQEQQKYESKTVSIFEMFKQNKIGKRDWLNIGDGTIYRLVRARIDGRTVTSTTSGYAVSKNGFILAEFISTETEHEITLRMPIDFEFTD